MKKFKKQKKHVNLKRHKELAKAVSGPARTGKAKTRKARELKRKVKELQRSQAGADELDAVMEEVAGTAAAGKKKRRAAKKTAAAPMAVDEP
mmetsp:Transcript_33246/g.78850  ORF Transcript_33246/g.78850 Transcript_33246/m.78850 type:complete len:92 (+) Transcript_33246:286-561(+)